jgi:hypothetical protein
MDDDLAGRLVANVGVDCTAAETADSKKLQFLLTRKPSKGCAFVHDSKKFADVRPLGKARSVQATARFPAVDSGAGAD